MKRYYFQLAGTTLCFLVGLWAMWPVKWAAIWFMAILYVCGRTDAMRLVTAKTEAQITTEERVIERAMQDAAPTGTEGEGQEGGEDARV